MNRLHLDFQRVVHQAVPVLQPKTTRACQKDVCAAGERELETRALGGAASGVRKAGQRRVRCG